jgi:prepilin-type N-terminal cleavage/methylation domain-containing protein
MFKKIQAKIKNKKGFTLVELLIVIAVLGIIAAIAVPRFTGVLSGVKDKADISAAKLWAKEIEAEFMIESWDITKTVGTTTAAVAAIATKPREGFDGVFPNDMYAAPMTASITRTGDLLTGTYKLTIKNSKGTELTTKDLTPPIN